MPHRIPQAIALRVPMKGYLAADHVSDAPGLDPAVVISKDGAGFGNPSAGATVAIEIGSGWYYVDLSITDTGALGPLVIRATHATMDPIEIVYQVVDAPTMGAANLTNLDAAVSGLPTDADVNAACDSAIADAALATAANLTTAIDDIAAVHTHVADIHDTDLPAVKSDTAAILLDTGTDGVVVAAASKSGYTLSAEGVTAIWAEVIEGTITAVQAIRGILATAIGKISGAATTTVVIRDASDTKARITATVSAEGNRTAITKDLT